MRGDNANDNGCSSCVGYVYGDDCLCEGGGGNGDDDGDGICAFLVSLRENGLDCACDYLVLLKGQ